MHYSTKTYGHNIGLSAAFRQWRAESHCNKLHGYALAIKFVFQAEVLDHRNWVVDFGGLKGLKGILEDSFDHKTLVAEDDPCRDWFENAAAEGILDVVYVPATGCEAFAELIFHVTEQWLRDAGFGHVSLYSVEVSEHGANSAIYTKD